jgi:hypothetical protein
MLSQDVRHITLAKMEALDCAHALSVAILVRYEQWETLATLAVVPSSFLCAASFAVANQAVSFLKKARFLPTDREAAETRALTKWWECERMCFSTNRRLSPILHGFTAGNEGLDSYIRRVQFKMKRLLGRCPDPLGLTPKFGPGATMSDRSTQSTVPDKLSSQVTLTSSSLFHLHSYGTSAWGRG